MTHGTETWLPVVGWELLYEVSDHGRVRSIRRTGQRGRPGGGILKQSPDKDGYLMVSLHGTGRKSKRVAVHVLVLTAFKKSCPAGHEGCHGPNGQGDNSLDNLEWGTRIKNLGADKVRDGTIPRGEQGPKAKLTWAKVAVIREQLAAGVKQSQLAADYEVTATSIRNIQKNRTWVVTPAPPSSPRSPEPCA